MNRKLVLVAALAALFLASSANALIIDEFTVGQSEIMLNGPVPQISSAKPVFWAKHHWRMAPG